MLEAFLVEKVFLEAIASLCFAKIRRDELGEGLVTKNEVDRYFAQSIQSAKVTSTVDTYFPQNVW